MRTEYEVVSAESLRMKLADPDWLEAPLTDRVSPLTVVEIPDAGEGWTFEALPPGTMRIFVGVVSRAGPETRPPGCIDVLLAAEGAPDASGWVAGPDLETTLDAIATSCDHNPDAALGLVHLLRAAEGLPVGNALVAEAATYSMLLGGPEFRRWRSSQAPRSTHPTKHPVVTEYFDDRCTITLNRPEVHNAYNAAMRDSLIEVLRGLRTMSFEGPIVIRGAGKSFCSGGDLSEFGRSDPATAYMSRLARSPGVLLAGLGEQVTAWVHGSCVGAGAEIAAFCNRVQATSDAVFRLPEVSMGLVPGAGGTVSFSRRIGRCRTAYLALTGVTLDAATAGRWGLVDTIVD